VQKFWLAAATGVDTRRVKLRFLLLSLWRDSIDWAAIYGRTAAVIPAAMDTS
jgi:hypothetical protein